MTRAVTIAAFGGWVVFCVVLGAVVSRPRSIALRSDQVLVVLAPGDSAATSVDQAVAALGGRLVEYLDDSCLPMAIYSFADADVARKASPAIEEAFDTLWAIPGARVHLRPAARNTFTRLRERAWP